MGQNFWETRSAREVSYLMREEWALNAEDVIWRGSKLGIRLSAESVSDLEEWILRERKRHSNQADTLT